ncbi:protein of unknown function [Bartonella clarridgeiae 73]|uniref:Uncharacterized protein n=1 Tax=Bartonella clarridgeiae (strain CCUG 45776 / CIP 104772 / 73) TaxID=696125 RepID=E6YGD7_BARC7|nr:protein of unknown function [Bartonella clarridgeiae 73]
MLLLANMLPLSKVWSVLLLILDPVAYNRIVQAQTISGMSCYR